MGPHRLRRRRRPAALRRRAGIAGRHRGRVAIALTALVIGLALRQRKHHVGVVAPARRRMPDARVVAAMTAGIDAAPPASRPAEGSGPALLAALRCRGVTSRLCFRPRCLIFGHDDTFARRPGRLMSAVPVCGRGHRGVAIGPSSTRDAAVLRATPRRSPVRLRCAGTEGLAGDGTWRARATHGSKATAAGAAALGLRTPAARTWGWGHGLRGVAPLVLVGDAIPAA